MILVLVLRMAIDLDAADPVRTHQRRRIDDMHAGVGGAHRIKQRTEEMLTRQVLFERTPQTLGRTPDASQTGQAANGALALQRHFLE